MNKLITHRVKVKDWRKLAKFSRVGLVLAPPTEFRELLVTHQEGAALDLGVLGVDEVFIASIC